MKHHHHHNLTSPLGILRDKIQFLLFPISFIHILTAFYLYSLASSSSPPSQSYQILYLSIAYEKVMSIFWQIIFLFYSDTRSKFSPFFFLLSLLGFNFFLGYKISASTDEQEHNNPGKIIFNKQSFLQHSNSMILFTTIPTTTVILTNILQDINPISSPQTFPFIILIINVITISSFQLLTIYYSSTQSRNLSNYIHLFIERASYYLCISIVLSKFLISQIKLIILWIVLFQLIHLFFKPYFFEFQFTTFPFFDNLFFVLQLPSNEHLKEFNRINSVYIISNGFLGIFILSTVVISVASNVSMNMSILDILMLITYLIALPSAISSIKILNKYFQQGPYQLKIEIIVPEQQQQLQDTLNEILSVITQRNLAQEVDILLQLLDKESISANRFYIEFISDVLKLTSSEVRLKNQFKRFELGQSGQFQHDLYQQDLLIQDNQVILYVHQDDYQEKATMLFSLIEEEQQIIKSSPLEICIKYEENQWRSEMHKDMFRMFLKNTKGIKRGFVSFSPVVEEYEEVMNLLYVDIMRVIATERILMRYIPVNPIACVYDLYGD